MIARSPWPRLKPLGRCSDEDLMRMVCRGEIAAFGLIYDRHAPTAYSLAVRLAGRAQADDVVCAAFLAIWRQRESFCPEHDSLRTWLLTTVRRHGIAARRARPQQAAGSVAEIMSARLNGHRGSTAGGNRPAMPAAQREAIELAYFEGLTDAEIATLTAVSVETVKRRMGLALRRLDHTGHSMVTPARRFLRGAVEFRDRASGTSGGSRP